MIILIIFLKLMLYLLLFILVVVLILLLSPIYAYGEFSTSNLFIKGHYLFGSLHVYYQKKHLRVRFLGIKVYDHRIKKNHDPSEIDSDDAIKKTGKEKKDKKKKKLGVPNKEVIVLTLELIKKLIKIIATKSIVFNLTLGLNDPYDTGLSQLIYQIVVYPLNRIQNYHFNFIPVYDELMIDYEGHAHLRFSIMELILPCLRYLLRKPVRQYLQLFQRNKKV